MFIPITSLKKPPAVFAVLASAVRLSPDCAALIPSKVLFTGLTKLNVVLDAALNNAFASVNFSRFFKLVSILPPYLPILKRAFGTAANPLTAPNAPPAIAPPAVPSGPTNEPSIAPISAYSATDSSMIPALYATLFIALLKKPPRPPLEE